jgi:hypothetical protein
MSVSHRTFLGAVYAYNDAGADGAMASTYAAVLSPDTHGLWWCAKGVPTGRESTLIGAADHTLFAVLNFAAESPVEQDSLVIIEQVQYLVRAVLVRDYGRDDLQVLVERTEEVFQFVGSLDPNAPAAVLALSSDAVTFTAVEDAASPSAAFVMVSNSGGGVLAGRRPAPVVFGCCARRPGASSSRDARRRRSV